jgi:hypothetical protein
MAPERGGRGTGDPVAQRPAARSGHGQQVSATARTSQISYGILADRLGLDVFALGEHHSLDFAVSSPAVTLAAVAQAIGQIRLTSAVSVLSTPDRCGCTRTSPRWMWSAAAGPTRSARRWRRYLRWRACLVGS